MLRAIAVLLALCGLGEGFFVSSGAQTRTSRPRPVNLFGGGPKKEGGGLSNVASMMENFKKTQEVAKKSQELQEELARTEVSGTSSDGNVLVTMTGQQTMVSAKVDDFESYDGAALSTAFTEAIKAAQTASLQEMNVKMQMLYKEMGFDMGAAGGEDPAAA